MNSNSKAAEGALRRETGRLGTMIKALAWEECRVGGVIAGWCLIVGLLGLAFSRASLSASAWSHDPELILLFAVGMPMLTALLLILSTDYSGHLVGGFSQRILHLPVRASAAVVVALLARTVFVFVSAFVFTTACYALFGDGPGIGAIPGITLVYLLAQTIDWLRKPLSGLSSLLIVAFVVASILLGLGGAMEDAARSLANHPEALAILLCLALAPAYGVAVAAVHAARVGRRIGIPELWEWPRYISVPWLVRSRPFATPLAAQVWFDLRRTWWILPGVTVLFCIVVPIALWLNAKPDETLREYFPFMVGLPAFAGIVFGAVMHGGLAGRRYAKTQAQFLNPLTSAQFAFARIITNATILVPVVAVVLVLHLSLDGNRFISEVIPNALAIDATSYREVLWVLLGRGLLVGLIAWPLMNGGNRTIAGLLAAEVALAATLGSFHWNDLVDWHDTRMLLPVFAIAVTIGACIRAWKTGVLSLRALCLSVGVWALATWVLLHAEFSAQMLNGSQWLWYTTGLITCLAWGALIPLPYVGTALDVRRRRHGKAAPQDPVQHITADTSLFNGNARTVGRGLVATLVVFLVWLAWPARPAYEAYWRAHGYPVTLQELNNWYPEVPDSENRALAYLKVVDQYDRAHATWVAHYKESDAETEPSQGKPGIPGPAPARPESMQSVDERLLIVGSGKLERGIPIAAATWRTTEAYWQGVTSKIAPELEQVGAEPMAGSRYPIDLRKGFATDLPYLANLRNLARQLSLDSVHWTIAGDPERAAQSIDALFPLANSLSEEPLLISQLVRFAILGIAYADAEDLMNRSVPSDQTLVDLERTFSNALPPADERMMLDHALVGEATVTLNTIASPDALAATSPSLGSNQRLLSGTAVLFWQLVAPAAAERMAMMDFYNRYLTVPQRPSYDYAASGDRDMGWLGEDTGFFAPLSAILTPALSSAYDAEWRIRAQFDIARTAIAVERYRLANGRLPDTLQELVPTYLPAVPMDYFAGGDETLRYRQLGGESYVVYSVGRNARDDNGEEMDNWWSEGDITFTVAPLRVRTDPQVAPA